MRYVKDEKKKKKKVKKQPPFSITVTQFLCRLLTALASTCLVYNTYLVLYSNIFYREKHSVPTSCTSCDLLANPPTKIPVIIPNTLHLTV